MSRQDWYTSFRLRMNVWVSRSFENTCRNRASAVVFTIYTERRYIKCMYLYLYLLPLQFGVYSVHTSTHPQPACVHRTFLVVSAALAVRQLSSADDTVTASCRTSTAVSDRDIKDSRVSSATGHVYILETSAHALYKSTISGALILGVWGLDYLKICRRSEYVLTLLKMSHYFIQNCCWIILQVLHHQR